MMSIHSIAAGGGSIIGLIGARLRVGRSVALIQGRVMARRAAHLTINILLGRIQPAYFQRVFGPKADESWMAWSLRTALPNWRSA